MLAYLLPLLLTSAKVSLVFDDPVEAMQYHFAAVSTATISTDTAFLCDHTIDSAGDDSILCSWNAVVQLKVDLETSTNVPTPVPSLAPTKVPTPVPSLAPTTVPIRIS